MNGDIAVYRGLSMGFLHDLSELCTAAAEEADARKQWNLEHKNQKTEELRYRSMAESLRTILSKYRLEDLARPVIIATTHQEESRNAGSYFVDVCYTLHLTREGLYETHTYMHPNDDPIEISPGTPISVNLHEYIWIFKRFDIQQRDIERFDDVLRQRLPLKES